MLENWIILGPTWVCTKVKREVGSEVFINCDEDSGLCLEASRGIASGLIQEKKTGVLEIPDDDESHARMHWWE